MANMNVNQRTQYERAELSVPSTGVNVRAKRVLVAYTVLGLVLVAALGAAVIAGIDNWVQGLVLGVIVLTTIGLMIAVSPNRRG